MTFRLHSRLVLWNIVIIGLVLIILGYFLNLSVNTGFEQEIEARLLDEASLAHAYLKNAAGTSFDASADELARLLRVRVTIVAPDGSVLGDSEVDPSHLSSMENHQSRPEVQMALQEGNGVAIRRSDTLQQQFIYVARNFGDYTLRLAMPLSAVEELTRNLRRQLALAMLVALLLTFAFGYVVFGLISRPLREMAAASQKLAAGDLDHRLPITGDEEIAALGGSLNTMAHNLSARMLELSSGKRRLELILEAMRDGVMVLDQNARVVLANSWIANVLGTNRDVLGRTPLEIVRRPQLEHKVQEALADGSPQQVQITTDSGKFLQATIAPVPNALGANDSVVVVFHDVTDMHNTERMRRDFVANVSHEFKTPLTSIRGYAETLLSGAKDDPGIVADFLKTIERNAKYLEALVNDLLTLARIEAELPASMEHFPLRPFLEEQLESRRSAIEERHLDVGLECPAIELRADRSRLATAVSNLIDNAIQYNFPGGQIRVIAEVGEGATSISITDTGVGIPANELSRIFERFYRVDKARTRESGSTGLGLSIVKHAVESQGGKVSVTSRVGTGSTFTIRLPNS